MSLFEKENTVLEELDFVTQACNGMLTFNHLSLYKSRFKYS